MRRFLITGAIGIAGLVALLVAWIAVARSLSLALDRIHTVQMDSKPITEIVFEGNGGTLRINDLPLSLAGTGLPSLSDEDEDRSGTAICGRNRRARDRAGAGGKFVRQSPARAGGPRPAQIDRSMLSWPTPLEINFISGHSPSWKRHFITGLIWEKPDGGRLEMVWRYEQYFYDDWASGFMTAPDGTRADPRGHSPLKSANLRRWQIINQQRAVRSRKCFVAPPAARPDSLCGLGFQPI